MTLSDQIIQVLDALCEKFGIVVDWTSANVVPYLTTLCEKLVSYEIWTSVAWIVISIIGFICVLIAAKHLPAGLDSIDADDFITGTAVLIGAGVAVLCIVGVIGQTMDIIKCVTFPELFVFEYIQDIINSGT
jgi:hypothetical protein